MTTVLQSHVAGRWFGTRSGQPLASAVDGHVVAAAHADDIDFGAAVAHARSVGVKSLLALDFQQRAAILKALAKYLGQRKEELYNVSRHTGATRSDGQVSLEPVFCLGLCAIGPNALVDGRPMARVDEAALEAIAQAVAA